MRGGDLQDATGAGRWYAFREYRENYRALILRLLLLKRFLSLCQWYSCFKQMQICEKMGSKSFAHAV